MASSATNSGIITDETSGERHIPESVRADGSKRKAIKIRPGYRPPEDVEVYKNRPAEAFRERGKRIGIPGAAGLQDEAQDQASASASSNKNAKRREARKKAKAAATEEETKHDSSTQHHQEPKDKQQQDQSQTKAAEAADPEVDREKKARNLKKKLKQARELKMKKDGGEGLLPEQIAKVIKINELIRELEALGFGPDGEPKDQADETLKENGEEEN
ncbi:Partner of Y14 and mago [Escovopsis weberi]|uniref:Partner of Y14 and mago n=1 Tax=Escovopsis weberi TaxID=150374 RepID=A0A0M8N3Y7_ESCWE|nr:Partner of Y14 and mago [Escovopsis weberi]